MQLCLTQLHVRLHNVTDALVCLFSFAYLVPFHHISYLLLCRLCVSHIEEAWNLAQLIGCSVFRAGSDSMSQV
jgi:hypothetical protein